MLFCIINQRSPFTACSWQSLNTAISLMSVERRKFMVKTIPITKARINLGEVIKRVHLNKENFVLEKGGIPVAAILDIDEFEDWLEMKDPKIKEQIRRGYKEYKKGKTIPLDKVLSKIQSKRK